MRRSHAILFVHLVWRTWDRLPLIKPEIERRLYRQLASEAMRCNCTILAVNGTPDHVHLLVQIPATLAISDLVKQLKGSSSHFVNAELHSGTRFKWQGAYGAYSISRWDVGQIANYIRGQKEHHRDATLMDDLEAVAEDS